MTWWIITLVLALITAFLCIQINITGQGTGTGGIGGHILALLATGISAILFIISLVISIVK